MVSPSLSQDEERVVFDRWISEHSEPTFFNPPNLGRDRVEVLRYAQRIRYLRTLPLTQEGHFNLAETQKYHEFSSWRLFPINFLPDDVILYIFYQGTFCSPEVEHSSRMPLLYSKVCKKWRTLVHEASWLWAYIAFNEESPYNLTRYFIERSRSSPLFIEINITDPQFDYQDDELWPKRDHLEERMSILLPHAHRWRSFLCHTDNWDPLAGVIRLLNGVNLPLLRHLDFIQDFPPDEIRLPVPIFRFRPPSSSLGHLRLIGVPLDWEYLSTLRLNLFELTIQELPFQEERPSLKAFYNILAACKNLRKLSIVNSGPLVEEFPRGIPPLSFPCLEHLDFRGGYDDTFNFDYLEYFLGFMKFGSKLRTLTIGYFLCESNFDRLIPVLSRFRRVECLHIGHMQMTGPQLARWFEVFSNVSALYLYGEEFQVVACHVLSSPARYSGITSTRVLCPALRTLSPFCVQGSLIGTLALARANMDVPLITLAWNINQREDVEEMPQLPYLRSMVRISYEGDVIHHNSIWVGPYYEEEEDMDL